MQERSTKHATNMLVTGEDFRTKAIDVRLFTWLARVISLAKPVLMEVHLCAKKYNLHWRISGSYLKVGVTKIYKLKGLRFSKVSYFVQPYIKERKSQIWKWNYSETFLGQCHFGGPFFPLRNPPYTKAFFCVENSLGPKTEKNKLQIFLLMKCF